MAAKNDGEYFKMMMKKKDLLDQIQDYWEGQSKENPEVAEFKRLATVYRFLPRRDYDETDVIAPGVMALLEINAVKTYCYIAPEGGGLVLRVGGAPVQVITAQSPLGGALLGKSLGDEVQVMTQSGVRNYRILGIR